MHWRGENREEQEEQEVVSSDRQEGGGARVHQSAGEGVNPEVRGKCASVGGHNDKRQRVSTLCRVKETKDKVSK